MKLIVFLIVICTISSTIADAQGTGCSTTLMTNPKALEAITFLKKYEGMFKLGSCSVEIQVCDESKKDPNEVGSFAADALIIDAEGFQRYVPFFIIDNKNDWEKEVTYLGTRAFVYRFKDKNHDLTTGSDERYDIEIVKKENSDELDYIEIGYSSEVERRNHTNKKWITCGVEREEYEREHPILAKLKSIWWLITHPNNELK